MLHHSCILISPARRAALNTHIECVKLGRRRAPMISGCDSRNKGTTKLVLYQCGVLNAASSSCRTPVAPVLDRRRISYQKIQNSIDLLVSGGHNDTALSSLGVSRELHLTLFPQGKPRANGLVRTTDLRTSKPALIASGMLACYALIEMFQSFGPRNLMPGRCKQHGL